MRIEIDSSELETVVKGFERMERQTESDVKKQVQKSGLAIEATAKQLAPSKSGNLRSSIQSRMTDPLTAEVTAGAAHAAYVEFNTRAHIIRPKKKKYLRFKKDGKWVFAKLVRHPGTREQPFMRPALAQEEPIFLRDLKNIVGRGL